MFDVTKELIYGQLGTRKHYLYVVSFMGEKIASDRDKAKAIELAKAALLGAWQCGSRQPIVSVAKDGTPISTREYAPGEVETIFHRGTGFNGSSMGGCAVDGRKVTPREYHEHFVQQYNEVC